MRDLIVNAMVTTDGVMQAPGGPDEDRSGGFEHGGWVAGYWDEEGGQAKGETMADPYDLVLGRRTYEIFAAYWPHAEEGLAKEFNSATKYVASTTLSELEWENSRLIEGEVPDGIRAIKEQDGPELQVHGSANLIQTLLAHDLVDELRLQIFPLVLGKGKRLFGDGAVPTGLDLQSAKILASGVIIANYRAGAEIKLGSF